jgi:hypothetical protein
MSNAPGNDSSRTREVSFVEVVVPKGFRTKIVTPTTNVTTRTVKTKAVDNPHRIFRKCPS